MFKIGDWVYLSPSMFGRVDTQLGIVEAVYLDSKGRQRVDVYWEKHMRSDGGSWRANWLLKV